MNRQQAKMALIPLLAGALWMVMRQPAAETETARPRRPEFPTADSGSGGAAPSVRRGRKLEQAEIVSFDPFAPPAGYGTRANPADGAAVTSAAEAGPGLPLRARLRIEAIVKRGGAFQAVIAGKVFRTGDVIDGGRYRVTAITADDVTFNRIDGSTNP